MRRILAGVAVSLAMTLASHAEARERWTEAQAKAWYDHQPWLVGSNYAPASAINQLEMWQAETWDPKRIDNELNLAQGIGMNTMRVFLHDQLWEQDPEGFKRRLDEFLTISHRHGIKPLFVLFDSVLGSVPEARPAASADPGRP